MPFSLQDLFYAFSFLGHQKIIIDLSCRHFLQDSPAALDFGNPSADHIRQGLYVLLYFFQGLDTCIDDVEIFKATEHGPHIFLSSFRAFFCQDPAQIQAGIFHIFHPPAAEEKSVFWSFKLF